MMQNLRNKAAQILVLLKQAYPTVTPPLVHRNPFELLIATILSAQTTDTSVNKITPELFTRYPDPQSLSQASYDEVARILRPIGFHNTKAKNIIGAADKLVKEFNAQVPRTLEELITLPGVGRKVASVVLWQAFGINAGFTVDTHVLRLAKWFGLTTYTDPLKVEQDLMQLFPQDEWGDTSLRLIFLGRELLTARNSKYQGTIWEEFLVIC